MSGRRWLLTISGLLLVAVALTLAFLPALLRQVAINQIGALAQRPVQIDRVDANIFTGRLAIHGFRLAERDGRTPFADFKRLDARVHVPSFLASLLAGHLHLRELLLTESTVRVVRVGPDEFNFSDLIRSSEAGGGFDVTVDRFVLTAGTVSLEDQALPERRTWTSENMAIDARNVSTRRDDGSAVGRSITAGAPVTLEITNLRLRPVHLQATVRVEGLDLTPARIYLPPDAPVILESGRASTTVTVSLDHRTGVRIDGTGRFEDVALARRGGGERLAHIPELSARVTGFAVDEEGSLRLEHVAIDGAMSVRDARVKQGAPFRISSVRANISDLTWPATTPGRVDVLTSIPGGGTLALNGTVQPPPAPTQLRLRLTDLDVAPWAGFLPLAARVTGVAEADLRMNEPLAAGVPARVQGSIAVNRLAVADRRQELLSARRIEAAGLAVHWPSRLVVERVRIVGPRGLVERDRAGDYPMKNLVVAGTAPAARPASGASRGPSPFEVEIGEIVVQDGAMRWRDEAVSPPARLDVSRLDGKATGIGWPMRGSVGLRMAASTPGGGRASISGRVGLEPLSADLRVTAQNALLEPYQPYLPTTGRVAGTASCDLAVAIPSLSDRRITARGTVALGQLDVRDRERSVMKIARASATGIDLQWPERIVVDRVDLAEPWVLVERNEKGELSLNTLVRTTPPAAGAAPPSSSTDGGAPAVAFTVARVQADRAGVRVVDRAVSPPFALDVQPATLRAEGLSTVSAKPARVSVDGRMGPGAQLTVHGTLGTLGKPLRLDLDGEIREFAVPRANPYVLQHAGWKTTEGRLTSKVHARVDADALSAKTEVRVSRLQLVKAEPADGVQARIGLPLGMLTSLLKDRRGDITASFAVGGRLSDPRFDFREAIWNAVRTVAVKAITLPVSWIGRVQFTPDSRIERIEVDPVTFEAGTSTLTADGQQQVTRLVAFLEALPEARMGLTPVTSSDDVQALERQAAAARKPALGEPRSSDSPSAAIDERPERDRAPAAGPRTLAERRLETVKTALEQAGVDPRRLIDMKPAEREPGGRVEVNVVEPETERPSKLREALRRFGAPLKDQ